MRQRRYWQRPVLDAQWQQRRAARRARATMALVTTALGTVVQGHARVQLQAHAQAQCHAQHAGELAPEQPGRSAEDLHAQDGLQGVER
ncbi:hypothetical protein E2562_038844 [Oryza meyeriana var. granulata]|uniref:Uncharacterized protein n=1 Tax=Oryza meyeriana var. granulata TaxID=110450 RepID=A0A6G1CXL8_9ORYZ|nr:hypothetical protein E2562_038844 [Oryza meyeriana var. granulata]